LSDTDPLGLAFDTENDKLDVLELLKQRQPPSDSSGLKAAERQALFASNKDLQVLYNQLVPTGILSEAEFWSKHSQHKSKVDSSKNVGMRLGLSSIMHEVEKLHDGKTERVNIQLTPQDIQRIFRERPEVNRAFVAYVPHSMSEEEFWQKYFKLEYKQAARRKKIAASGLVQSKTEVEDKDDIFAPFRKHIWEEESRISMSRLGNVDPTLNLFAEYGDRWGGGTRFLGSDASRSDEPIPSSISQSLDTHSVKTLANELNRHSLHVLDGPLGDSIHPSDSSISSVALAATIEAARKRHLERDEKNKNVIQGYEKEIWKYRASSDLEDLRGSTETGSIPLSIKDKTGFGMLTDTADGRNRTQKSQPAKLDPDVHLNPSNLFDATLQLTSPLAALEEFCMMGSEIFVKEFGASGISAASIGPEDSMGSVMVDFFRLEALKTNELLRHFWSAHALRNGEKVARFKKHLLHLRETLVIHLQSKPGVSQNLQIYIGKIVKSLIESIDLSLESS
jgi:hypothetical protein